VTPSSDIFTGEVKLFTLEIDVKPSSNNYMVVKFLTPINDTGIMEICNANIIKVGRNMPCVQRGKKPAVFEKRFAQSLPKAEIYGVMLNLIQGGVNIR
jgi:hypothetical protein